MSGVGWKCRFAPESIQPTKDQGKHGPCVIVGDEPDTEPTIEGLAFIIGRMGIRRSSETAGPHRNFDIRAILTS